MADFGPLRERLTGSVTTPGEESDPLAKLLGHKEPSLRRDDPPGPQPNATPRTMEEGDTPRRIEGDFCPYCGAGVQDDFDFCPSCGKDI